MQDKGIFDLFRNKVEFESRIGVQMSSEVDSCFVVRKKKSLKEFQ